MTVIEARTPINISHPDRLYIGGEWVTPAAGGQIDLVSPATEQVFANVAEAREPDMDKAVAAARKAFDEGPWPKLTHAERADYLRRMADILEPRIPELASAWTEQIGGLAAMGPGMHFGGVMQYRFYADLAGSYEFERRQPSMVGGTAVIVREPVGVVAAIAPWNAPFMIMTTKVAPALLAGCTVIMKPAPETPLETYILAEAAEAANSAGRSEPGPIAPRGGRPLGAPSGRGQGRLHRIDRGGPQDRHGVRRAHRPLHPGARRQVGGPDHGRLRHRPRRQGAERDNHGPDRPGLRHAQPRDRAEETPRRTGRGHRRGDEAGDHRRSL
jgi:hypothetical protein